MNEEERLEEEHAKQMLEDALYDEEKERRAGFFEKPSRIFWFEEIKDEG